MKKHQSIVPKKISLSILGLLSTFSSVAAIALINSQQQLIKITAPTIDSTIKDQIKRNITDNITNNQSVNNPDEIFYTEQDLATKDVWNATTKDENTTNKGYFDSFKTNLEKITDSSPIKDELLKIDEEIKKYIEFKKFEKEYTDNNNITNLIPWDNIKDAIKQQLGDPKENFEDIEQLKNIDKVMTQLSGLTEDQPVSSIKQLVAKNLKSNNLTATGNTTSNLSGVEQIAGTNFTNLIKIAEIDLTQQQNFILDYTYQATSASNAAKSHLIIRNDQFQVKDATNLKSAYDKLDIFGRYEPLPKGATIGDNTFPQQQKSIVLKKENDRLIVLARLKQNEILRDISFSTDSGQPDKFGILDVQASNQTTFRKIIENRNTTGSEKLMDDTAKDNNSNDQLVSIQFFSSEFFSKRITNKQSTPSPLNPEKNRYIQIYQGIETVGNNAGGDDQPDGENNTNLFSLDLNYVTRFAEENGATDNDYEPIKEYVAGVATNKTISIDLTFDGTNPSQINEQETSTYNFFVLLKDTMDKEILKLFPNVSEITVRSSVDRTNKIAKQEIGYSDLFYLIGNPSTKVGIDNSTDLSNKIPDLTRKIFAEKPEQFNDPTPTQPVPFRSKRQAQTNPDFAISTIKANEQIDEKINVIQTLGAVYDKWANNDPTFNNATYTINVPTIDFDQKGSQYSNININRKDISANGYQLVNNQVGIDKYWKGVSGLITTKFNPQFQGNQNRFTYNTINNTGLIIVEKWLVNNFEFIPNYANVDAILSEGIKLWNDDLATNTNTGTPPTLDKLNPNTQRSFAALLAKLIEIQYEAIVKEFESNQMFPIYKSFQNLLNVETQTSRSVVGDVTNIVESQSINAGGTTLSLIQYQTNGWDNVFTKQEKTLKDQLLSLINLLRFGGTDDDRTLLADAILTNPVIALKFKEFSAENLVNFVDSQPFSTKLNQLRILDGILSYFGYSFIDSYTDHINGGGTADNFKLTFKVNGEPSNLTFEQVLEEIINKLVAKTNEYKPTANEQYQSIWLDNIIAGTNVIRSMNWKLRQLNNVNPAPPLQRNISLYADEPQFSSQDLIKKINDILGQQQGSPAEQAAWQGAINNGSKRFDQFSEFFSGRGGADNVEKIFNAITQDKAIMERRTIDFNEGYLVSLTESLKYIWFIILALIGVGVMAASSIGIATKSKQAQLSKHPIIKWVLFSLIGLGLLTAVLALVFGLPAVL